MGGSEARHVVEGRTGQVEERIELEARRGGHALDLAEQGDDVVGGDAGRGVIGGAIDVGHAQGPAAQGLDDRAHEGIPRDGEGDPLRQPARPDLGRRERHQRVDGPAPGVWFEHADAQRCRQVHDDAARIGPDGLRHRADRVVGRGNDEDVDARGGLGRVIVATEESRDMPASGAERLGQRTSGPSRADETHRLHRTSFGVPALSVPFASVIGVVNAHSVPRFDTLPIAEASASSETSSGARSARGASTNRRS